MVEIFAILAIFLSFSTCLTVTIYLIVSKKAKIQAYSTILYFSVLPYQNFLKLPNIFCQIQAFIFTAGQITTTASSTRLSILVFLALNNKRILQDLHFTLLIIFNILIIEIAPIILNQYTTNDPIINEKYIFCTIKDQTISVYIYNVMLLFYNLVTLSFLIKILIFKYKFKSERKYSISIYIFLFTATTLLYFLIAIIENFIPNKYLNLFILTSGICYGIVFFFIILSDHHRTQLIIQQISMGVKDPEIDKNSPTKSVHPETRTESVIILSESVLEYKKQRDQSLESKGIQKLDQ